MEESTGLKKVIKTQMAEEVLPEEKAEIDNEDGDSSSWESMDEEEDSCHKLSQNTLVLEKIFDHLSSMELLKCRLVSKLWSSTALLKNQLGNKTKIRITNDNVDKFIQTSEKAAFPFCRQFDFQSMELELSKVIAFNKVFKNCLTSISMKFCTAKSPKSLVKLLHSPNLSELKITGNLPEFGLADCLAFGKHKLQRLTHLELTSSLESGHVSQHFIKNILQNSPILHSVSIGRSNSLWKTFVEMASVATTISKLDDIRLFSIEVPLMINELERILQKQAILTISFKDCIVGQSFLQEFLLICGATLKRLIIEGTQHEILSRVFFDLPLKCLTHLTLPIDGMSIQDGSTLLNSLTSLQELIVVGLFQAVFMIRNRKLIYLSVEKIESTISGSLQTFTMTVISEKRREFLKVVSLIPLKPLKMHINLPELNSHCLRRVFQKYPELQELQVKNNSRGCLDAWTGIPIKTCRKLVACRSFSVANAESLQRYTSVKELKKLQRLELSILDEPPKAEFTLLYVLYGICQLPALEQLRLNNVTMSDIAFLALSKMINLKFCYVNGSLKMWNHYKSTSQNLKIRSFLLPPDPKYLILSSENPLLNIKVLQKVFSYLPRNEVFRLRKVSKFWHSTTRRYLHQICHFKCSSFELENYLEDSRKSNGQASPNKTPRQVLSESQTTRLRRALNLLQNESSITTLVLRGMNKSMLEFYQRENIFTDTRFAKSKSCADRRKITYWFYPDGSDDLISTTPENSKATSITVIGSWTRKDSGLLEFLNPSFSLNSIILFGLLQEVYDLILPKLTTIRNLESISIIPFTSDSVSEVTRSHFQILANSSFSLKHLSMQKLRVPPETIANFVKSHRYTLETLSIQNHVNVSDKLSFNIPNLKCLQLDEPPGVLLLTTLNINQSLKSVHFERSGYMYNQVKSKAIPKLELEDQDFEHSASEMLCDVNLFLECVATRRPGAQKSILQESSDSALKFFNHFRFLTSLTLRSVHAHYGLLQGIFRNLNQLQKLVFTNTTQISDSILTGFPTSMLDTIDLLNPLQLKQVHNVMYKTSYISIRSLKNLTYLSMDDQTHCTDFSVIFGVMKLKHLKFFSCKKWKITDVSLRAISDMTSIEQIVIDGTTSISNLGIEYLQSKAINIIN